MAQNPADRLNATSDRLLATLRQALTDLHDRQSKSETAIGTLQTGYRESVDSLVARFTTEFTDLLTDSANSVEALQSGDFVSAAVAETASLIAGPITLTLESSGPLPFLPSPVVMISRSGSPDDYAIARKESYNPATRKLTATIISVAGDAGPHDDLFVEIGAISAIAGPALLDAMAAIQVAVAQLKTDTLDSNVATVAAIVADNNATEDAIDDLRIAAEQAASEAADDAVATAADRDQTGLDRIAAAASAAAAATFDPSSYYPKTETYTQAEINAAIAAAIDALLDGAPGALDTLNELAAAIADDASFAASVTAAIAAKADASHTHVMEDVVGLDDALAAGGTALPKNVAVAMKTDTYSRSSSTFGAVTGLSVSITPESTDSRIIVLASISVGGSDGAQVRARLAKGGSALLQGDAAGSRTRVGSETPVNPNGVIGSISMMAVDSPASTSAQTYAVEIARQDGGTVYANRTGSDADGYYYGRAASTLIAIEVGP